MTNRICKFGCETLLSGWDDNAKKFIEAGSGGLHTRERCEELKSQLAAKNNHGNETATQPLRPTINTDEPVKPPYVDHTIAQGPKLKLKILTDPTPEGLALAYNNFGENHKIQFSQYHPVNALYTIAVWYEEMPLKQ